jgi:Zn-dependent protease with chaperone function
MTLLLAAAVVCAIAAPHFLALDGARPGVAATIWLAALALRALSAVFVALFAIFYLPASEIFGLVTHWCWQAVIPVLATHLPLGGHELGNVATVVPSFALAASLVSVAYGLARASRAIRVFIRRSSIGRGPQDTVIVGGAEFLVAAAGLARPRVLVSAGALAALDEGELRAGLAHERGHIAHRHRFVLLVAEFFRAGARFLPGTRRAMDELSFHLERDADAWAMRRSDPLDLASAICKAAGVTPIGCSIAVSALSGHGGRRRVEQLLSGQSGRSSRLTRGLAAGMVGLTLALVALLPAVTWAGVHELRADRSVHHCHHHHDPT